MDGHSHRMGDRRDPFGMHCLNLSVPGRWPKPIRREEPSCWAESRNSNNLVGEERTEAGPSRVPISAEGFRLVFILQRGRGGFLSEASSGSPFSALEQSPQLAVCSRRWRCPQHQTDSPQAKAPRLDSGAFRPCCA